MINTNKKGMSFFEVLVISFILIILLTMLLLSGDIQDKKEENKEYYSDKIYNIYSIDKDKKNTNFVLWNWIIESKPVYYAYVKKENKEGEQWYILKELPWNSIIIEFKKDSLNTAHVEEKNYNCKEDALFWKRCNKEVTIFIPENSIIKKIQNSSTFNIESSNK